MIVVKYGEIVGSYYKSNYTTGKLIIVALGAPNIIDVDKLRYVNLYLDAGYDVIVPEYYGYNRSGKLFTPQNSIKTLIDTKKIFKKGVVQNIATNEVLEVSYKKFYFVGISYGGGVVALLPKYDKNIENIALIYPVLSYAGLGKSGVPEQTAANFIECINTDFKGLYRGLNLPVWETHFLDESELIPTKNIRFFESINIFLSHGKSDKVLYYKNTENFYKNINRKFPENNCKYYEFSGGHDDETLKESILEIIKYFNDL